MSNGSAVAAQARILLVEDHLINQRVALSQLRKLGYQADLAPNGGAALDALGRSPYDAILMDCQMPDMDGYEATARIRGREAGCRHTIIIAMTSHAMEGDRQKCLAAGMDDYLAKPVTLRELGLMLERWLAVALAQPFASASRDEALDAATTRELRSLGVELFDELAALFLEDASEKMAALRRAGASRDAQVVEKLAHGLKGSSSAIGASRMQTLCAAIQEAAAGGQVETAGALCAGLETEFARVRLVFEQDKAARRPVS